MNATNFRCTLTAEQVASRAAWFARIALSSTDLEVRAIMAARAMLAIKAWSRLAR